MRVRMALISSRGSCSNCQLYRQRMEIVLAIRSSILMATIILISVEVLIISFEILRRKPSTFFFFLNDPPPPEISPFPLHAALPISPSTRGPPGRRDPPSPPRAPCSAARCAAASPPLPPPITTRSNFSLIHPRALGRRHVIYRRPL